MKTIKLGKKYQTIVDDEDFEYLSQFSWTYSVHKKAKIIYACRRYTPIKGGPTKTINMHREILKPEKGLIVDHKNGNGLDNQRSNLRIATYSQNGYNSKIRTSNKSGYKGVSKQGNLYRARIHLKDKTKSLGLFKTKEEAAKAYNIAALEHFGEFARINEIK